MKKQAEDSFAGTAVLVESARPKEQHPRSGQIGRIVSISESRDLVEVKFNDGKSNMHRTEDLLTLHSGEIILKGLLKEWDISNKDCQVVLHVIRLLSKGNREDALRWAQTNDITRAFCLIRLSSCLTLVKTKKNNPNSLKGYK
ncbi:hypothetical protein [Pedobacter steynii]|uniref:Uncharacterized protein n=1 Tax=Pedobacter steynii TaxID=430522 RepID=A0A1D7QN47_9SPHI|nr:hypothetical protein [Pedobacter steynii]AOM80085.1 hypothetical protein BFS30_24740 [Pedobacter steynii]